MKKPQPRKVTPSKISRPQVEETEETELEELDHETLPKAVKISDLKQVKGGAKGELPAMQTSHTITQPGIYNFEGKRFECLDVRNGRALGWCNDKTFSCFVNDSRVNGIWIDPITVTASISLHQSQKEDKLYLYIDNEVIPQHILEAYGDMELEVVLALPKNTKSLASHKVTLMAPTT